MRHQNDARFICRTCPDSSSYSALASPESGFDIGELDLTVSILMPICWARGRMRDGIAQVGHNPIYLVGARVRTIRIVEGMHRYTEVLMTSPVNCLADVKRREQRVAIH